MLSDMKTIFLVEPIQLSWRVRPSRSHNSASRELAKRAIVKPNRVFCGGDVVFGKTPTAVLETRSPALRVFHRSEDWIMLLLMLCSVASVLCCAYHVFGALVATSHAGL